MYKRISLTAKFMVLITIVTLINCFILERYNSFMLKAAYEEKVLAEMKEQALIERLQFDKQFKGFHQVAEYAAIYPPLILHMMLVQKYPQVMKAKQQRWFLKRTMIPTGSQPKVVALFNPSWQLRGGFYSHIEGIPKALHAPSSYLRSNFLEQSMLTLLDGKPWVLSASKIKTISGDVLGYVLIASPIDSQFLNAIYRYNVSHNLIVLGVNEDHLKIIASSDPQQLAIGQSLTNIEENFVVTGKEFFDYGSSDISLTFLSLRGRQEIALQVADVMKVASKQSYIVAAALMLVFWCIVAMLGYRMRKLSQDIAVFSQTELKASIGHTSTDSLLQLEEHIAFLEQTIVEVREQERETAEALSMKRQHLQEFFEQAIELIHSVGPDGHVMYVNQGWLNVMGYSKEEALQLSMQDFIHPDSFEHCQMVFQKLQQGEAFEFVEASFLTKAGAKIDVQGSIRSHYKHGEVVETYAIFRDVTAQKCKQEQEKQLIVQMEHAQRLESLGVLAGGIAHDFNNILTAIMGNAMVAAKKVSEASPIQKHLGVIVQSSERAADLCKSMLAYSGKGSFIIEPVNLADILKDTINILSDSLRDISLKLDIEDALPCVEGDKTQLQQLTMNLLSNAREAIEGKGEVGVKISTMYADQQYLEACSTECHAAVPGRFICMEVSDNGSGMDAVTIEHIFEPFFTTKFTGRGLGMSAMLGIVRGHKGAIHIDSTLGQGTTIKVLMPVKDGAEVIKHDHLKALEYEAFGQGKTILVVDDEAAIRDFTSSVLACSGFDVLMAENGADAVRLFRQHAAKISLVLLDMTMAVMGGEEAYSKICDIDPHAKVIIASGYSEDDTMGRFFEHKPIGFIAKPYRPDALTRKLLEILNA